jgi:hypothetical protein
MKEKIEYVYVFINEHIPESVKIGTTTNVGRRIKELSANVPENYKCFHSEEVNDGKIVEKFLHKIFEKNRIRENREFFRIKPEEAKDAIQAAVKFYKDAYNKGLSTNTSTQAIKKPKTQERSLKEKPVAKKTESKITLQKLSIPVGSVLHFTKDNKITCEVINIYENKVSFEGRELSLSRAAVITLNSLGYKQISARGISFWKYKGETLFNIYKRITS